MTRTHSVKQQKTTSWTFRKFSTHPRDFARWLLIEAVEVYPDRTRLIEAWKLPDIKLLEALGDLSVRPHTLSRLLNERPKYQNTSIASGWTYNFTPQQLMNYLIKKRLAKKTLEEDEKYLITKHGYAVYIALLRFRRQVVRDLIESGKMEKHFNSNFSLFERHFENTIRNIGQADLKPYIAITRDFERRVKKLAKLARAESLKLRRKKSR